MCQAETEVAEPTGNTFTVMNSFWFIAASLLGQGVDVLPRQVVQRSKVQVRTVSPNKNGNLVTIFNLSTSAQLGCRINVLRGCVPASPEGIPRFFWGNHCRIDRQIIMYLLGKQVGNELGKVGNYVGRQVGRYR